MAKSDRETTATYETLGRLFGALCDQIDAEVSLRSPDLRGTLPGGWRLCIRERDSGPLAMDRRLSPIDMKFMKHPEHLADSLVRTWNESVARRDALNAFRAYGIRKGGQVYEIFSYRGELHLRQSVARQVYRHSGRVMCSLDPCCGISFGAFGQFNQTYLDYEERGNRLHMYRTFTSEAMLEEDLAKFKKRYRKRTGVHLDGNAIVH